MLLRNSFKFYINKKMIAVGAVHRQAAVGAVPRFVFLNDSSGSRSAVRLFNIARQAAASTAAAAAVHRRRRRTMEGEKGRGAQITHHESILAIGSGGG